MCFLLAGLAVVALAGWLVLQNPEPKHHGKRLGEWVDLYSGSATLTNRDDAGQAIRDMGTNAIPFLIGWIEYDVLEEMQKVRNSNPLELLWYVLKGGPNKMSVRHMRGIAATKAIALLDTHTRLIVPELERRLNMPGNGYSQNVGVALGQLGAPGLPPVMNAISNAPSHVRCRAILSLPWFGSNAMPAVPLVVQSLYNTNAVVLLSAADTLRQLNVESEQCIRVLVGKLNHFDYTTRQVAVTGLSAFGAKARVVVPVLIRMAQGDNAEITADGRRAATEVLEQIAPEVLTNAPVLQR